MRFWLFMLGALAVGVFWIGIYVGISYLLGEEIAKLVGKIGTKVLIGVITLVVVGLLIRAGVSKWRVSRQARLAGQDPPKVEAMQDSSGCAACLCAAQVGTGARGEPLVIIWV